MSFVTFIMILIPSLTPSKPMSNEQPQPNNDVSVTLVPADNVVKTRNQPFTPASLTITNNSHKEIQISYRQNLRYNLTTTIEDNDGKFVSKVEWWKSYPPPDFKVETCTLSPKQSVSTDQINICENTRDLPPGKYQVKGEYFIDKKAYTIKPISIVW